MPLIPTVTSINTFIDNNHNQNIHRHSTVPKESKESGESRETGESGESEGSGESGESGDSGKSGQFIESKGVGGRGVSLLYPRPEGDVFASARY